MGIFAPALTRDRTSYTTGQLLGAFELAPLLHPPEYRDVGPRLSFFTGLPVPDGLRLTGMPLGTNQSRGTPIPVFQPSDQPNRCVWAIGSSRKGKSTMIVHRCQHLARAGQGCGLLDAHRTTAFALLGALEGIDPARIMFLDFEAPYPLAWNSFAGHDAESYGRLTLDYLNGFKALFDAGYPRMQHFLGMALFGLFVLNAPPVTLPLLFARTPAGEQLRRDIIALVKNEAVRRFWQEEFPTYSADAFAPLTNRFSALLLDPQTSRNFSQRENRVDFAAAMDEGKIVIIAAPTSIEIASIVGGLVIAQFRHAAFRRAGTPRAAHHFHFIADEAHRFLASEASLESIIHENSKGGLSLLFSHQSTGQLPSELLKALYSMPNIFVFGIGLADAKQLAQVFNGQVSAETLAGLTTGEVYARLGHEIVNFQVPPPVRYDQAIADRIIAYSYDHYYATATSTPVALPRRTPRIIDTFEEEA